MTSSVRRCMRVSATRIVSLSVNGRAVAMRYSAAVDLVPTGFGPLLRRWRTARRLSQLDLSLDARISSRHLSFLETGQAKPSREMVLALCTVLDVPARDRNALLLAAGFAPAHHRTRL